MQAIKNWQNKRKHAEKSYISPAKSRDQVFSVCISVYHLLFFFILAEFITTCLQSNANTRIPWWCDKFKTKSILPGAFLFFSFFQVCQSVNSNAMYSVPLQCLVGWPPSALAPTHVAFPWLWPVKMNLSWEPWHCWRQSPFAFGSELMCQHHL